MANGVDATVKPVQAAGRRCSCDRTLGVAKMPQLTNRHDAMLALRQRGEIQVWRSLFLPHSG